MDSTATRLHEAVAAVCPIAGVSVGRWADRATWVFDPLPTATPDQTAAAAAVVAAFDASDAATTAWEEDRQPERKALRAAVARAVADIDTYLAVADTGTAAQQAARDHAAMKRLAQITRAVIRRLAQID
jgi:hypothetical protein